MFPCNIPWTTPPCFHRKPVPKDGCLEHHHHLNPSIYSPWKEGRTYCGVNLKNSSLPIFCYSALAINWFDLLTYQMKILVNWCINMPGCFILALSAMFHRHCVLQDWKALVYIAAESHFERNVHANMALCLRSLLFCYWSVFRYRAVYLLAFPR